MLQFLKHLHEQQDLIVSMTESDFRTLNRYVFQCLFVPPNTSVIFEGHPQNFVPRADSQSGLSITMCHALLGFLWKWDLYLTK